MSSARLERLPPEMLDVSLSKLTYDELARSRLERLPPVLLGISLSKLTYGELAQANCVSKILSFG